MRRPGFARAAHGFTLIELLVALTILAIAAAIATLSVGSREGRDVDEEVRRMAALFRLAQNHAGIYGTALVWEADVHGYRFRRLDHGEGGEGESSPQDDLLRARRWPFAVTRIEAQPIVFGREPLLQPGVIRLSTASRDLRLALDPFGNLTEAP
ncbi:MAG TPA: GspH/FimT family pseudopilin [Burkholderiales bacterium]